MTSDNPVEKQCSQCRHVVYMDIPRCSAEKNPIIGFEIACYMAVRNCTKFAPNGLAGLAAMALQQDK